MAHPSHHKVEDGQLVHLETREPRQEEEDTRLEVLLTAEIVKDRILQLTGRLKSSPHIQQARLVGCRRTAVQVCQRQL